MHSRRRLIIIGLLALAFAPAALAQHSHGTHEHGVAELRVAVDGNALLVEFESPMDSLVGFEGAPRTKAQREALAGAEQKLTRFEGLFIISPAAGCTLQDVQLALPWSRDGEKSHLGHDHKDGDKQDDGETHADLQVTYKLLCADPQALDKMEVQVFKPFPRIHSIRAETATPRGQGSSTLNRLKTALPL